ncbi:MAG: creatininase [Hyphomicrobiaceae bacterium]
MMAEQSVLTGELTWPEFEARMAGGDTPVIIPLGSHEQHGLHMPLSTDVVLPTEFARRVARRIGALVAPTFVYGYKSQQKSGGGQHIPGTLSLDGATYVAQVKEVIKELARNGARRFVMVNGHYENSWFMVEGIDLALRELRWDHIRDVKVVAASYWDFITPTTIAELYPNGFPGIELEHGGVMETSLMLALRPDLVHMDRVVDHPPAKFPPYDVYPVKGEWTPRTGCLSSPKEASREKGETLLRVCTDGLVGALETELKAG